MNYSKFRVIVSGSRNWSDCAAVGSVLDEYLTKTLESSGVFVLIEGGAKGADACAKWWAQSKKTEPNMPRNLSHYHIPADWQKYGKAAGSIRNQLMLDTFEPDLVLAFKDNLDENLAKGGTEHMIRIAKIAGVEIHHFSHDGEKIKKVIL